MSATLLLMLASLARTTSRVDALFMQVAPKTRPKGEWSAEGQKRAVVLIQGLQVHPFSKSKVERASLRDWQQQGSPLLKRLDPSRTCIPSVTVKLSRWTRSPATRC